MRISFANKKLEKLCNRQQWAARRLGPNVARILGKRLEQIERAACVSDLVEGNPHQLTGDRAGEYAVSLASGSRLVFAPDQDPAPAGKGGGIDWSAVSSICITFIGDYHG